MPGRTLLVEKQRTFCYPIKDAFGHNAWTFCQDVKPDAQRKPRPSATNPKTPPGLCYSLFRHLQWLPLAFKGRSVKYGI
ncbi:hypothetical protein MJT46_005063 [Ovis ammon polii x Ovis aries]|nr:hypothetical protein MJT46_005063 [Ovis ammon polii x Ovis aries]